VVLASLISTAVPVFAHHSFEAEFDRAKQVTLTGTVTKVEWMNPHTYFYIDVKDPKTGKVQNWACEMGSPNGLTNRGWTRNTLRVGLVVTVPGSRAKDGSFKINAGRCPCRMAARSAQHRAANRGTTVSKFPYRKKRPQASRLRPFCVCSRVL
jgi:hypothetical protein